MRINKDFQKKVVMDERIELTISNRSIVINPNFCIDICQQMKLYTFSRAHQHSFKYRYSVWIESAGKFMASLAFNIFHLLS